MDMKYASQLTAGSLALGVMILFASVVESAYLAAGGSPGFSLAAAAEPVPMPGVKVPAPEQKKEESAHPPVKPAPAESRTPEDAAARAADPKDPSGALIVQPPLGTGSPAKPR